MVSMNDYIAIEKVIGTEPRNSFVSIVITFFLTVLTLPLQLLALLDKGYTVIIDSDWEVMLRDADVRIEKRQIAATGFDNFIKFYSLTPTDRRLNELLKDKVFGDFVVKTETGIFFRQFKSPRAWPNSSLIYISLDKYVIETVTQNKSSYPYWQYNFIDDKQFDIVTESTKDYSKVLQIRLDRSNS